MSNKLPSDYQEVEYIESTGTQYIVIPILPTINSKLEITTTFKNDSTNPYTRFGIWDGSGTIGIQNYLEEGFFIYYGNNWQEGSSGTRISDAISGKHKITLSNGEQKLDDVVVSNKTATEFIYEKLGSNGFSLIGRNYMSWDNNWLNPMTIHEIKWYEQNILTFDFIPCYRKLDDEIGLYDLVSDIFYTNSGQGIFLKGDNVYPISEQLDYLIETKQQIKDALETPNNIMRKYPPLIKKYVNNQPTNTVTDGVCTNALGVPVKEVGVDGNSKQETTEGKQLLELTEKNFTENQYFSLINGRVKIDTTNANENVNFIYLLKSKAILPSDNYTLFYRIVEGTYNGGNLLLHNSDNAIINESSITSNLSIINFNNSFGNIEIYTTSKNIKCILEIMLVSGTKTADDYIFEKYTGGQPSPNPEYKQDIEVIDGVNKANKDVLVHYDIEQSIEIETRLSNNDNPILMKNGEYELNCKCKNYTDSRGQIFIYDKNMVQKSFINWSAFPISFTLNEECYIKYVIIKNTYGNVNIDKSDIELLSILPKNAPYLPYGHIGLEQSGKNLFDKNKVTDKYINNSGELLYSSNTKCSEYIDISNQTKLIRTSLKNSAFYDKNKVFISLSYSKVLNVPQNAKYVVIEVNNNDVDTEQLEQGSTATPYEPYHSPKIYPINLNGNTLARVGDIKDLLKIYRNGDVEIGKKISKHVFDGNENFKFINKTDWYIYSTKVDNIKNLGNNISNQLLCNYFISTFANNFNTVNCINKVAVNSIPELSFALAPNEMNNADKWKQYLATLYSNGNPLIVYYLLAEPQTIQLPSIEPIELWEGTNNFKLITNLDTTFEMEYVVKI